MDYRQKAETTPTTDELRAAERERNREAQIRRAERDGNAPIGRDETISGPGGHPTAARLTAYTVLRPRALADYDRLRAADPAALRAVIFEAVATLHGVPAQTVCNWVNSRAKQRRKGGAT